MPTPAYPSRSQWYLAICDKFINILQLQLYTLAKLSFANNTILQKALQRASDLPKYASYVDALMTSGLLICRELPIGKFAMIPPPTEQNRHDLCMVGSGPIGRFLGLDSLVLPVVHERHCG